MVVTMQPQENVKVSRKEDGTNLVLKSADLSVALEKATGRVTFSSEGETLLREKSFTLEERTTGADKGSYMAGQVFTFTVWASCKTAR